MSKNYTFQSDTYTYATYSDLPSIRIRVLFDTETVFFSNEVESGLGFQNMVRSGFFLEGRTRIWFFLESRIRIQIREKPSPIRNPGFNESLDMRKLQNIYSPSFALSAIFLPLDSKCIRLNCNEEAT